MGAIRRCGDVDPCRASWLDAPGVLALASIRGLSFRAAILGVSVSLTATPPAVAQRLPPRTSEASAAQGRVRRADARRARHLASLGVRALAHHDWALALQRFEASWALDPRLPTLLSMATCESALHRPIAAVQHLEDYVQSARGLSPGHRAAVRRRIQALSATLAAVTVHVEHPEATLDSTVVLTVDDEMAIPERSFRVTAGHHVLQLRAGGHPPVVEPFDALPGRPMELAVRLAFAPERASGVRASRVAQPFVASSTPTPQGPGDFATAEPDVIAAPISRDAPPAVTHHGINPAAFYAALGGTTVAAAAWGLSALLAQLAVSDFNTVADAVARGTATHAFRQQGTDDYNRAHELSTWSDIALGTAIVGAVVTTVLYFRTDFAPANPPGLALRAAPGGLAIVF